MKKPTHKWAFRPRFRANAFGWKASKLASQRLKEALTEIKAIARVDSLIAADGAILLMEKIWPALAHVDLMELYGRGEENFGRRRLAGQPQCVKDIVGDVDHQPGHNITPNLGTGSSCDPQ